VAEQPLRATLGGLAVRHLDPEIHGRAARRHTPALALEYGEKDVPLAPVRVRARSTCASSLHATTDARCTNSWGAAPVDGRYVFSAETISGGPATKPER
jgi:hypothetical protein